MPDFATYQKFTTLEEAREFIAVLEANQIPYLLENPPILLGSAIVGEEIEAGIALKIDPGMFKEADRLVIAHLDKEIKTVAADHFLRSFSTRELEEVLEKQDEWGLYNFVIARKLLAERGDEVDTATIQVRQEQRLKEIAQPLELSTLKIVLSYVLALLMGFIGIFVGYSLWTAAHHLPDGRKVYMYSNRVRRHGRRMVVLSLMMIVLSLIRLFGPSL